MTAAVTPRQTSWNADELMAAQFPEPRWAVPGIIPEGASLLAGAPKLGKSWLMLNVAAAVASGGRALGRIPVISGDVLCLALEDTPRRLQGRLRASLGADPPPPRLTLDVECPRLPEGGADRIEEWLTDHPEARLVVIDVLTRVRAKVSDRTNAYNADYEAMAAVKKLSDAYGVAFVAVHHTRKATADDFLDSVSGTHGLAGAADAVLVLQRARGSGTARLRVTGRDIEEADYALDFAADIGTWTLQDGPAGISDERRRILDLLTEQPGLKPKEIADATEIDHDVVRQLVRRMLADTLDTDGNGRYFPAVHHSLDSLSDRESREHTRVCDTGERSEWVTQRTTATPVNDDGSGSRAALPVDSGLVAEDDAREAVATPFVTGDLLDDTELAWEPGP